MVVGRGHEHGVDLLAELVEHLAIVVEALDLGAVLARRLGRPPGASRRHRPRPAGFRLSRRRDATGRGRRSRSPRSSTCSASRRRAKMAGTGNSCGRNGAPGQGGMLQQRTTVQSGLPWAGNPWTGRQGGSSRLPAGKQRGFIHGSKAAGKVVVGSGWLNVDRPGSAVGQRPGECTCCVVWPDCSAIRRRDSVRLQLGVGRNNQQWAPPSDVGTRPRRPKALTTHWAISLPARILTTRTLPSASVSASQGRCRQVTALPSRAGSASDQRMLPWAFIAATVVLGSLVPATTIRPAELLVGRLPGSHHIP